MQLQDKSAEDEGEKEMKIILTYDLGEEANQCLIEWLQEKIDDKSNPSPLRYVDRMEIEEGP